MRIIAIIIDKYLAISNKCIKSFSIRERIKWRVITMIIGIIVLGIAYILGWKV